MKKYDSYKDSGVEWIGDIPKHWEVSKSKFEINVINGFAFKSEDFEDEGTPVIRIGDLKPPYVDLSNAKCIDTSKYKDLKPYSVINGDLLLAMTGATIGKTATYVNDEISYLNQRVGLIKPLKNNNAGFTKYIYDSYFFREFVNLECSGSAQENIGKSQLGELKIAVPNSEEQTAIANYLDLKTQQIDHLIAKKEAFIQLLEEERITVINQAVTKGLDPTVPMKDSGIEWLGEIPEHWEIAKIKRLSSLISKGTTPSTVGKEVSDKGEIRYLKSENIVDNQLLNTPEFYIDNQTNQILKRSQLEKNDVLIVIAGASIGKVAILTDDFCPSNTNQAVSFIRLTNPNSSYFVWYWLQSSYIKERILLDATQSAQPNLSMESIGNFYIPKISFDEEQEIIKFLTQKTKDVDAIILKTKQEIELLKEYKTALISEVVTGKVDVRNEKLNK